MNDIFINTIRKNIDNANYHIDTLRLLNSDNNKIIIKRLTLFIKQQEKFLDYLLYNKN